MVIVLFTVFGFGTFIVPMLETLKIPVRFVLLVVFVCVLRACIGVVAAACARRGGSVGLLYIVVGSTTTTRLSLHCP